MPLDNTSARSPVAASEYLKMEVVYIGACECDLTRDACAVPVAARVYACVRDTRMCGYIVYVAGSLRSARARQDSFSVLHVITLRACRLHLANANLSSDQDLFGARP